MTTNAIHSSASAPFVDPDGFASWQRSPEVRAFDASARRVRDARSELHRLQEMIGAAEEIKTFLEAHPSQRSAAQQIIDLLDDAEERASERLLEAMAWKAPQSWTI